jgi:hypothetical protein
MYSLQAYTCSFQVSNLRQRKATLGAEKTFNSYPGLIIEFLAFFFIYAKVGVHIEVFFINLF